MDASSDSTTGDGAIADCSSVSTCWITETVGPAAKGSVRLALDPQGRAHILAWQFNSGWVYVTNQSGSWTTVAAPGVGGDLAVDSAGAAHVCAIEHSEQIAFSQLTYSLRTPSGWATEVVRKVGDPTAELHQFEAFSFCTIAASGASVQIAFTAKGFGRLGDWFYSTKTGSSWSSTYTGASVEGVGAGQIAAIPGGAWHLVHRTGVISAAVDYMVNGSRVATLVDYGSQPNYGEANGDPDIALDDGGSPHFSYSAAYVHPVTTTLEPSRIFYARVLGGTLHRESASCATTWSATAIALRGTTPHIAFQTFADRRAIHATRTSGGWTNEDLGPSAGQPGVAVDGAGRAHVAFVDPSGNLVHKRQCP